MGMKELVEVSNRYGSDEKYVLAGGGNTSWKNDEYMFVKGSGTELATIGEEGFVKVALDKLDAIWDKSYSQDTDVREEEVLADLMASRYPSEEGKRPSVETLLHGMLPFSYVVHTHPSLVNGVTCSRDGEKAVTELFGSKAVWVPVTNPGYILAREVKDRIAEYMKGGREYPQVIFLQNHGVFVSANTLDEIDAIYEDIFGKVGGAIKKNPDCEAGEIDGATFKKAEDAIKEILGKGMAVKGVTNGDILRYAASEEAFAPLALSFTPDHIVYYGFKPVYAENLEALKDRIAHFKEIYKDTPRLAVVKDVGAFSFNSTESMARKGVTLFLDDVKIAVYTESFGGFQFMEEDKIDFIRNWEAEKYRASASK